MGRKIIIKGADFSLNAVSQSPNYEEELIGTSKGLWSYASLPAAGNSCYGFIAPYDCYVIGVEFMCRSTPSTPARIGVFNVNVDTPVYQESFECVEGLNHIEFNSIELKSGQVVGLGGANILYCTPSTKEGDFPTNSFDGVIMEPPYRCYTINFIVMKAIDE